MGVIVPRGTDVKINFSYNTPGLVAGILVSLLSLIVISTYLVLHRLKNAPKKKATEKKHRRPVGKFSDYAKMKGASFKSRLHGKYLKTKFIEEDIEITDDDLINEFVPEEISDEDIYELYEQDGKAEEENK